MSSTITNYSNSININYPIPGADNDSQGFRTNFSKIQSALTVASNEISNLQVNSVNLSTTNDFGNNVIKRASLQAHSEVVDDHGMQSGSVEVDYATGSYHIFEVGSGTHTFNVINWPPTGKCGTVRLEITSTSTNTTSINVSGVSKPLTRTSSPVSYNSTGTIVWDVWSPDNGTTVIATEVSQHGLNITGDGNLHGATGKTDMTNGFFYIPAAAGAPSGVPTAISGQVPMYYDSTNNYFYVYNGAWKKVTLS